MKFQRGQSIVEFALILPFFLFIIYFIFYICGIFADYLYLNNIIRDSARVASVVSEEQYKQDKYESVYSRFKDASLPLGFYDWSPTNREQFKISYMKASQNVQVQINAEVSNNGSYFVDIINNLGKMIGDNQDVTEKFNLNITYEMRSENKQEE